MTNTLTCVFTEISPGSTGELASGLGEEARHVVGERAPDLEMEGVCLRAPEDDVRLAKQGPRAHTAGKSGRVEVQRTADAEQSLRVRPADLERNLPMADIHDGAGQPGEFFAKQGAEVGPIGLLPDQQLLIGAEPQRRMLCAGRAAARFTGNDESERIAGGEHDLWTAAQNIPSGVRQHANARAGGEHWGSAQMGQIRHAAESPAGHETPER